MAPCSRWKPGNPQSSSRIETAQLMSAHAIRKPPPGGFLIAWAMRSHCAPGDVEAIIASKL